MFLSFMLMYAALTGATMESPAAGALIMQNLPTTEDNITPEASSAVTAPLSSQPLPEETTPPPQTALRIPFGGAVTESLARRVANHAGHTLAIEQIARSLSRKPGVRIFSGDLPRLMALGAPTHTLEQRVLPAADNHSEEAPALPAGELRVTVHWTQHRAEDDFLRECIADGISLESRAQAYAQLRRITNDCLRLIRDAAILRRENGDDDPQAERLAVLLEQLDDLRIFLADPFPPDAEKLERLLARNPGNPPYLLEFAELLLRMDQPTKALEALKALNGGVPQSGQALYLRGLAQLALRLPTLAIQDFTAALRLNPEEPGYWQGSAMAHAALDDTPAMCADLETACSLGLCESLEAARAADLCRRGTATN